MVPILEMDADMPPLEPGAVFAPHDDDITTEHAIPSDAMDLGISLAIQAFEEELASRWYHESAIASIVDAVRKRVGG
jgi:hypothetical protein